MRLCGENWMEQLSLQLHRTGPSRILWHQYLHLAAIDRTRVIVKRDHGVGRGCTVRWEGRLDHAKQCVVLQGSVEMDGATEEPVPRVLRVGLTYKKNCSCANDMR